MEVRLYKDIFANGTRQILTDLREILGNFPFSALSVPKRRAAHGKLPKVSIWICSMRFSPMAWQIWQTWSFSL